MRQVVSLSGTAFVLLCIVLVLLAAPVGAQDSGGIPPGTAATGVDTDNNNSPPDVIEVAASDCTVSLGASITLEDGDGTRAVFTDKERGITISDQDGSPRIVGPAGDHIGDHATFPDADTAFDTDGDYSVVTSTGVTCGGGGTTAADDQYGPGPVNDPKGVMPETVVVDKVPKTGGPPYIALAAVALLSVALIAGRAILRP
ncbi:hypothetical protein BH24ACT17_BH24ACT17_15570 [soil metagenome]